MPSFQGATFLKAQEEAELMINKQKDYGKNNILEFGEFGVVVRMNDKFSRLKNLMDMKTGQFKATKNETVEDTLMDIANYARILRMLRDGTFELPMEEGK